MATSSYLNADGTYNGKAIMTAAHAQARATVADAARRGKTRRYSIVFRHALVDIWISARTQRDCAVRDAEIAAMPADKAQAVASLRSEVACARNIDSLVGYLAAMSAVSARAAAMGVSL